MTVEVYRGRERTEAYLIQHWLADNGIDAMVTDVHTQGLANLLTPGTPNGLALRVTRADEARARTLIAEFLQPKAPAPPWTCTACGEVNDAVFGSCWKCQSDAPV